MRKILFFTFCFCIFANANIIKSISFNNLVHLSPEIAKEITKLQVGSKYDMKDIDIAIINLYKQRYFEDIVVSDDFGNIVFDLKEKPIVAKVDIDGIGSNDEKTLIPILSVKKGSLYEPKIINQSKEIIKQFFESKGYYGTVVEVETKPLRNSLEVVFTVNRGEYIIIKKVDLIGAKKYDYDDIEPFVANKQRELFGWMWGFNDGKMKIFELPYDSGHIKDYYLSKGYLDATVSKPYTKVNFDNFNASIMYQVNEGGVYKIDKISFSGDTSLINTKKLKSSLFLEEGDRFNIIKLRKDINIIQTEVANQGYAFAQAIPQSLQDKEKNLVSIDYEIIPGDKVTISNVKIKGNTKTADRVIRREMYLTEGQFYNKTDLQDSIDALRRTGYFEDVKINEARIDSTHMDLIVEVTETSTGAIKGGIGYGSSDGLIIDLSVEDGNILGSGLSGIISVSRDDDSLSGRIGLKNPRIYDSKYSLGGNIYARDTEWSDYDEEARGFDITLGRKLGRNVSASLTYNFEQSNITKLDQDLIDTGYKKGKSVKSAITPALAYDSTDDYYLPRRGIIAKTSLEMAGIGGDEKFFKNYTSLALYYGLVDLIDYDLILRYKARVGLIDDRGHVPVNEMLYLGGSSSIRGFDSNSISPKNAKGKLIGGTRMFHNSVEASIPLINRIKLRGALFYDYGMIGTGKFNGEKRSSTGINIEWLSPLGAIQLIFAKPLDKKPGDDTSSFEFTIGRRF